MSYFIIDRRGYDQPDLVGPFDRYDQAEWYANEYHPEDQDGSVWVLSATPALQVARLNTPYPEYCMHPERCQGRSACPRDISCIE